MRLFRRLFVATVLVSACGGGAPAAVEGEKAPKVPAAVDAPFKAGLQRNGAVAFERKVSP